MRAQKKDWPTTANPIKNISNNSITDGNLQVQRFITQKNHKIIELVTKSGLTRYKTKHSAASLPALREAAKQDKQHIKGAVFVVRDKADFTPNGVRGYVITSLETLYEDADALTHWTPNVYRKYGYTDSSKKYVKGHEETNLAQINTFVVDIDTQKHSVQEILMECIDSSIGRPTFIVKTTRGYQVYFVLDKPMFVSNKNDFKSLKIAKRISQNIKASLRTVDADLYCNDFGFYRIPTTKNVEWFDETGLYSFEMLKNWSMRQDDDAGRNLFTVFKGGLEAANNMPVSLSDWFNTLLNAKHIKGGKGQIGRNNAMFTLALVCMGEGKEEAETLDLLDEYNSSLVNPLPMGEVRSVVKSAYSGKYKGAQKDYVMQLLEQYVGSSAASFEVKLGKSNGWYKHKKERSERVRSHLHEREEDLIEYLTAENDSSKPFIWLTQKELCEKVKMPQSTLNKLMEHSTKFVKQSKGKGRNAITGWTTVELFIKYVQKVANELQVERAEYRALLKAMVRDLVKGIEAVSGYANLIMYLVELGLLDDGRDSKRTHESTG